MPTKIITHLDLDGHVSGLITSAIAKVNPSDIHYFGYGSDRDEQWKRLLDKWGGDVWFVDISLKPEELEWARRKEGNLFVNSMSRWWWIDHHESSLDFNPEGIFSDVHLDTHGDLCAADILWSLYLEYSKGVGDNAKILFEWTKLAHDRDLWINENRRLNMRLDMIVKGCFKAHKMVSLVRDSLSYPPQMIEKLYKPHWESGIRLYESSKNIAQSTKVRFTKDGYPPIILCWILGQASDIADTLYDDGDEIIGMCHVYSDNIAINLRTRRDDINLAQIAKDSFNGGGHPQAAGGRLSEEDMIGGFEIISNKIWKEIDNAKEECNKD